MHGRILHWLAATLAVAVLEGGAVPCWAQQYQPMYAATPAMADPAYVPAADAGPAGPTNQFGSTGRPSVTIGGRTYVDTALFSQSPLNETTYGNMSNGAGFRSVRLSAEGKAFEVVYYRTEIDFVGGIYDINGQTLLGNGIQFKDVYMGVSDLPYLGNVRVGHFKEPFSLEELTSSRFITFMERTMLNQLLVPSRNTGVMVFDYWEEPRILWQVGTFMNNVPDTLPRRDNDKLAPTADARLVWQPWYDETTEAGLLHLGAAYSYRPALSKDGVGENVFRARPNTAFGGSAAYIVQVGRPDLSDWQIAGAELAFMYGPFSFQSEAMAAMLNPRNGDPEATLRGAYFMVSYFLTGEHRGYNRKEGRFDRVKVLENFFRVRAEDGCVYTGKGAGELAYRCDYVDATDAYWSSARQDLANTHTLGVNWYLNPYARCMFDWVHADSSRRGTSGGCAARRPTPSSAAVRPRSRPAAASIAVGAAAATPRARRCASWSPRCAR